MPSENSATFTFVKIDTDNEDTKDEIGNVVKVGEMCKTESGGNHYMQEDIDILNKLAPKSECVEVNNVLDVEEESERKQFASVSKI